MQKICLNILKSQTPFGLEPRSFHVPFERAASHHRVFWSQLAFGLAVVHLAILGHGEVPGRRQDETPATSHMATP